MKTGVQRLYLPHTVRLERLDCITRELLAHLPEGLFYHNPEHTLHPTHGVVSVADSLSRLERIADTEREIIVSAAYLHDTGYLEQYHKNEPIGARIAGEILPSMGYSHQEISRVQQLILATQMPTAPHDRPAMVLCDADVDNLGRDDFFERGDELRRELGTTDKIAWYRSSISFLEEHTYCTASARNLRDDTKMRNITELYRHVREGEEHQRWR